MNSIAENKNSQQYVVLNAEMSRALGINFLETVARTQLSSGND